LSSLYRFRPKAIEDLDNQAYFLSTTGGAEIGRRFLIAAHETFSLLAAQPRMGRSYRPRRGASGVFRIFPVSGFEKMLILYAPIDGGVEIVRLVHSSREIEALLRREGVR
jgi:toxin ParE1/3/4